jgi:hypothetical protein
MNQLLVQNRFGQNQRVGRGAGRGYGGGRAGGKPRSGPGGNCICPECGRREPHIVGQRCIDQTCPECGTKMIRK